MLGSFCACNRGVLRLQTGAVLEPVAVVPIVQRHGLGPDSVKTVWRLRSCSSSMCLLCRRYATTGCPVSCGQSTGAVLGPVVHARCGADTSGDSTGAVLGQGVHVRVLGLVPMARQRRKLVELPQV